MPSNKTEKASPFISTGSFYERAMIMNRGSDTESADLNDSSQWWAMASAYKRSADLCIDRALDDDSLLGFVAMPSCFLYRHFLELSLKALAIQVSKLNQAGGKIKLDHSLDRLWSIVRDDFSESERSEIDPLITAWVKHDRNSTTFRYPYDKQGKPSVSIDFPACPSLRHLRNTVDEIDGVFYLVSNRLEQLLEGHEDYRTMCEDYNRSVHEEQSSDGLEDYRSMMED